MAAGGTLTLAGGSDYVFSSTEAWSGIVGNGSTQGVRLNTQGQTLTVSNLDRLIGGTSSTRKDVVTLAGTAGNTITVQALETLIGGSGNDRVLLTSTGATMVVESLETILGTNTGTALITLAGTTGNTMSVGYLKSMVGSAGKDVININAAGSVGSTMAVALMETLIGTDGLDLVATIGGTGGNTMFLEGIEIVLGNASASVNDVVHLASGGNTIGVAFLETLMGGSGNDVVTMSFKTGSADLQTTAGTLAVSSIETIVGGTGGRNTAILLDVGNTITVASLSTLIGGGGKDVVNMTLRDGTAVVGNGPIPWNTTGSTMLVSLLETIIGTSGDDVLVALNNDGMTLAVSAIEGVVGRLGTDVVQLANGGNTIQVGSLESVIGGTGTDVVTVRTSQGTTMTVSAVESIVGNAGTDVIQLGAGGNTVQVEGLETVIGGTGNDVVTITDTAGTVFVSGVETIYTPYQTLTLSGTDTYVSLPPVATDTTPPSITAVSIPDAVMKIGDTVTVTITVASDSDTYTLGTGSTVGGFALGNLTKVDATTYTATFTVTSGGTDVAAGSDVPVNIVLTDSASNSNTPYTTAISQGADRIDANRPTIASAAVNGTTLTVTFAEAMSASSAAGLTVTVAGQTRVATYASGSGTATLTFTLASAVTHGETVTLDYNPGTGTLTDTASNAPASVTNQSVTNSTPAPDATPPSITNVTIPNQPAKVGDTVTVTITVASDSDTYTLGNGSTVNGFALGNLTRLSATTYTATFTVTADGQRTGNLAANQDIPVNIVLVDSASNANTPYTTPISQNNDRIDTNAPPVLAVPTIPPTLVDTAANDTFPLIDGQLSATDLEGDTLTYSIAGSQASPLQYGSVTLSNGVTYDTWSTGPGGTSYVNSQTGHYAYVFDAAFLNGVPAGPMQGTSTFTVSDGNRTVEKQLTLNFTGANDSPILSNDVRSLTAIDQGIADAANTGTTVTALLASAGTATDAEYNSPFPLVTVVPLGIAVTGVTNTNGTWQYKIGTGAWTDIPTGSSNGSALLLAGSDRVRFVPSGSGFTNTDTGGLTFKAWDLTSGTAGSTADTSTDAYSTGSATVTITVDAVPTLTATGGSKTFGVGVDASTSLFSGVAASTVEAGQSFRGAVFTVSGVVDATEVLAIGGTDVALTNGATATLTGLGASGGNASVTVSVVGGVATVTVSGLERSDAQMNALLGGVTYKNTSATATLGNRTVAIAGLTDSGGATGSATISGVSAVVNVADVTAPAVPVVTSAALTNSATPTLAGTAEAGSTVTVTVGGATYSTTATGGTWSINLATATPTAGSLSLNANGTNPVSVTATDASNNTSTPGTQTLTVDTTAPTAPSVTSAALTNSATPTLAGTAEAGSTVTVTVGGATYSTTATGGNWSINLATDTPTAGALSLNANGANPVSATATDAAGNVSGPGTQSLTIDTTPPNAPTVTTALSNSTTPTLTGTAEAGSTVTVTVGGATYTTTATGGNWSINLATDTPTAGALSLNANGANPVSATATDAAGNVSGPGTQSLTIDTTLPNAPVVTSAALSNNTTPTLAGTAEAGATVTVTVGGATYTTTATGGNWSINLATDTPTAGALSLNANGANPVSATATDAAGNVSTPGTQSLTIDTTLPNAPTVTTALSNSTTPTLAGTAEAGATVTVTVGGATYTTTATGGNWSINLATDTPTAGALSLNANGANPVSATATDAAGNVSGPGTQSLTIDTTPPNAPTVTTALSNSTTPTLTGTAEAGSTVTVMVGGATYTTTATGGNWSINLATDTPTAGALSLNANGANPVSATATDAAGNVSTPGTQSLTIDTTLPNAPTVTTALSNSTTPTLAGTAEAGATVTVTVGGATYTTTATGGNWSINLATDTPTAGSLSLNANGANPISATATDASGNVSAPGTQSLVIDTTAPNAPAVTSAALSNSTTPTLTGSAEAGSTVTVTVGGATYTTTATNGGAWSLDLATATPVTGTLSLNANGANPVSATATDAAGNTSIPGTQSLTVDTTPPTATVLFEDDSIDAIEQSSAAFTISGGEAGTSFTWTITSTGGGQVTGSGVMSGPTMRVTGLDLSGLGDGTLTLTLGLTDPAGNASPPFTAATQKLTATAEKPAPVAPPPTATVDGATVNGSITTGDDGKRVTTVTIAASNGERVEDTSTANADLADVPVVREQVVDRQTGAVSTVTTLTVSVSNGVAVTTSGSAERQTAAEAQTGLTGLIAAIEARTDAGTASRGNLTGGGDGFLSVLSAQAQLLVRAIDFSTPGATAGQAVQTKVTGNTLGGTGVASTAPTAVVLNTSAAAGPVTIQLDNVEFAAVVGNATLVGGDGEQIVYGDDHQQYMYLGAGDDILHGGGGNDTIASAGGNDTLYGDDGDDVVMGGEGDDWLFGGEGNDLVGGGVGNDALFGGTGHDILFGEDGDDTLTGEEGEDTLSGGAGNDLLFGGAGNDFLIGDAGDDTISGGAGNDVALGGAGRDLIGLGAGDDLASGDGGDDTLFGEDGNDTLFGGAGNDLLNSGSGNDVLFADGGADTLWGGAGADVFAFGRASGGSVVMDFQVGVDRLALYDASMDLGAVIRSARVEGGNTTLDIGGGNRITILGQTGNAAGWFG
ncbi:Ig-like domain-containing protein [Azospirillum sp. Marseille-Q6669]